MMIVFLFAAAVADRCHRPDDHPDQCRACAAVSDRLAAGRGVVFFTLGAPFVAALEVIIYAGAIMVLFVFVMMMLNLGKRPSARSAHCSRLHVDRSFDSCGHPDGGARLPGGGGFRRQFRRGEIGPRAVGAALFGPYLMGVELASMLLLGGLWERTTWAGEKPRKAEVW